MAAGITWLKRDIGYGEREYVAINPAGVQLGTVAHGGNKWYPWTFHLNATVFDTTPKHQLHGDVSTLKNGKERIEIAAKRAFLA